MDVDYSFARVSLISVYFCLPYFTLFSFMLFLQYKVTKDFSTIILLPKHGDLPPRTIDSQINKTMTTHL